MFRVGKGATTTPILMDLLLIITIGAKEYENEEPTERPRFRYYLNCL
ncbi:MAG TPA: hypothetical protein VE076_08485 [Nitrososphaeraceae archaeon]|nr:hypothetical protein [Nitrososphaeraceae archaeon]